MYKDIEVNPKIAFCKINDAYHILNCYGKIFTTKNVSTMIWEKLVQGHSLENIEDELIKKFSDVDSNLIKNDIKSFVSKLSEENILTKKGVSSSNYKMNYLKPASYTEIWKKSIENKVPLKVDIELTNMCNLNCKYCYVDLNKPVDIKNIDYKKTIELLDELKEMGTLFITITGGEPTLHPYFKDILKHALKNKFYVRVLTNGSTLNEDAIKELNEISKYGLLSIDISMHSLKEDIFNEFTQKPGTFKRVMKTIDMIKQTTIPLSLVCNITNVNIDEIEDISSFCESNQIELQFNPIVYPTINNYSNNDFYIDDINVKKLIEKDIYLPKRGVCVALTSKCWIDYRGEVNLCELIRTSSGNITLENFKNIWSKLTQKCELKDKLRLDEECSSCNLREECSICPGILTLTLNKKFFCNSAKIAHDMKV